MNTLPSSSIKPVLNGIGPETVLRGLHPAHHAELAGCKPPELSFFVR
jgi:hypothetical protein